MASIRQKGANMKTRLIWSTPDAEKLVAYMARVSSPANQDSESIAGLLKYCIRNHHWSIFEMCHMCVEVETSRDVSAQMIRHRSFSFQEFSQRYAESTTIEPTHPRRQDVKNRQNSIDDISEEDQVWFACKRNDIEKQTMSFYHEALGKGIAKECARRILPMSTGTRLYMTGSIRSWCTYFKLRCDVATQLEHREVANSIKEIFTEEFPIISSILEEV